MSISNQDPSYHFRDPVLGAWTRLPLLVYRLMFYLFIYFCIKGLCWSPIRKDATANCAGTHPNFTNDHFNAYLLKDAHLTAICVNGREGLDSSWQKKKKKKGWRQSMSEVRQNVSRMTRKGNERRNACFRAYMQISALRCKKVTINMTTFALFNPNTATRNATNVLMGTTEDEPHKWFGSFFFLSTRFKPFQGKSRQFQIQSLLTLMPPESFPPHLRVLFVRSVCPHSHPPVRRLSLPNVFIARGPLPLYFPFNKL